MALGIPPGGDQGLCRGTMPRASLLEGGLLQGERQNGAGAAKGTGFTGRCLSSRHGVARKGGIQGAEQRWWPLRAFRHGRVP